MLIGKRGVSCEWGLVSGKQEILLVPVHEPFNVLRNSPASFSDPYDLLGMVPPNVNIKKLNQPPRELTVVKMRERGRSEGNVRGHHHHNGTRRLPIEFLGSYSI